MTPEQDIALRLHTLLQRPLPPEELAENTRAIAAPAEERDRLNTTLLIARLGAERLAIDVRFARRVVPLRKTHGVPHRTNDLFAGICSVHGEVLPVARLDRLLGITPTSDTDNPRRRMVVVGDAHAAWVVIVDRVDGIRRFDASTFCPPPATVSRALDGVTDALVPLEGGPFAARLDPEKLGRALARSLA
jgi:chemotaxis-related protein WspD